MIGLLLGLTLLACATLPWALLAARTLQVPGAIAVAVLLVFGLPFVALTLSASAGTDIVGTIVGVFGAVGVAGVLLVLRSRASGARPDYRPSVMVVLPSLLGSAVWAVTLAIAAIRSGDHAVAWAMSGDSANNLLFAREVIYRGGVGVGAGENPVPLTSAIMGFAMALGRGGVPPSELLRHDVTSFASVWALLIAVICALAGMIAMVIARQCGSGRVVAAVSGSIASMLPLSWLVSGYPMQYGFFNSHVALPLVLAGVLAFLRWKAAPAAALSLLMITATLVLAVWSPLVLLPAVLGLVVLVGGWQRILATRGSGALLLAISAGQLLAYVFAAVLPSLIAMGDVLGAQGAAITFPFWMLPATAVVATGLAIAATRSLRDPIVVGTAALAAASLIGLAILLAVSSSWTYYPSKFAWLAAIVLALIVPGMVLPAVARVSRRFAMVAIASVLFALSVLAMVPVAPTHDNGQRWQHPIEWVFASEDAVADQIFSLADLTQPRVLWESGDANEGVINFWLLQVAANSLDDNFQLRVYAYEAFRMTGVESLCEILGLMDDGVEVLTVNPVLEAELSASCPGIATIVVIP